MASHLHLENEIIMNNELGVFAIVQGDGNFITFEGTGYDDLNKRAIWSSQKFGSTSDYFITLQGGGNLVLNQGTPFNVEPAIWASGTQIAFEDFYVGFDLDKRLSIFSGTPEVPGDLLWKATDSDGSAGSQSTESSAKVASKETPLEITVPEDQGVTHIVYTITDLNGFVVATEQVGVSQQGVAFISVESLASATYLLQIDYYGNTTIVSSDSEPLIVY